MQPPLVFAICSSGILQLALEPDRAEIHRAVKAAALCGVENAVLHAQGRIGADQLNCQRTTPTAQRQPISRLTEATAATQGV